MSSVIAEAEQITPDWITGVLQNKGLISDAVFVTSVNCKETTQINCTAYHLAVSYSAESVHSAPSRLFLKIPHPDFDRSNKEVEFYETIVPVMLASAANWPFLSCYDAAYSAATGQAHLLFEDLSETHFTLNGLMPAAQNHREQVIDAYARLHSFWWEHPRLGQDIGELLTEETINDFLDVVQNRFHRLAQDMGEDLLKAERDILESVAIAWPARRRKRIIEGKGITLVHRDPHPRNFLYPKDRASGTVKLIDWQSWRADTGTDDVAYLMAFHWPFEARVELEFDLVKRYYEQLVKFGVKDYTWDDCWYDYRRTLSDQMRLLG